MKKFFVLLLLFLALPMTLIFATTEQARKDYQFQFDLYRQKNTEFQVAKNEYQKFKTLTSQTTALDKTKSMLSQRDQLLHSYLSFLAEKLAEDQGVSPSVKQQYISILQNELIFLEKHAQTIPSIGSIEDSENVSQELESHYLVLSSSIRQILNGLSVGQLSILGSKFDTVVRDSQLIMSTVGGSLSPAKQQTINRWILQIQNKRQFFQQKVDAIVVANSQLTGLDMEDLDNKFSDIQQTTAEARAYLVEGASFMIELKNALKYAQ